MMPESPVVERATAADLDALHRLLQEQFGEHDICLPADDLKRAVAEVLAREDLGLFLVAREGGQVVGMAAISWVWTLEHGGRSAWLDELYVLPEHRGRGLGAALVARVEDEVRALGCAALDLEVDEEHRRAERLYERAGFRRLPRTRWVKHIEGEGDSCAS